MIEIGSPQFLFMMEAEGLLDTREGKINAVINKFRELKKKGYNINNPVLQDDVLNMYKLDNLSATESHRIAEEVLIF